MSLYIFLNTFSKFFKSEKLKYVKSVYFNKEIAKLVNNFSLKHPEEYSNFNSTHPNFISSVLNIEKKNDVENSIKILETSTSPAEFVYLSKLYQEGIYVRKDEEKSKQFLEKALSFGDDSVLDYAGEIYYSLGLEDKALKYLEKSKNELKDYFLGSIYLKRRDLVNAKKHFELSDHFGRSLYELGEIYFKENNFEKALKYFEQSYQKGTVLSSDYLGMMYFKGLGCEKNFEKAYKHLDICPDVKKKYYLGLICFYGDEKIKVDYQMSFYCFKLSFDKGNISSAPYLGLFYAKGLSIEKDDRQAMIYFEKHPNNKVSAHYLGEYYLNGVIVEKDLNKSLDYFEIAHKLGNKDSSTFIGRIYFLKGDYTKAMSYHNLNPKSNAISLFDKGLMYFNGLGIKKDQEKGFKLIENAAQMNLKEAKIEIEKLKQNKGK